MKRLATIMLIAAAACSNEPQPLPETPAPAAPAPAAQAPAAQGQVIARMIVVDLEGNPLPGMMPIATRQPNAFDPPIARGEPTGNDGKGSVSLPANEKLCVRAWDPSMRYFTNNYFDVLPGGAETTELMKVVMVPGASLDVILTDPNGAPVANTEVALMMSHPSEGPWWPDQAQTDSRGAAHFPAVPPGQFAIMLKTPGNGQIQIPQVSLPPGGKTDLGTVKLQ